MTSSKSRAPLRMNRFHYSADGGEHWMRARWRMEAPAIRCQLPDHELLDCQIRRGLDDPDAQRMGRFAASKAPKPRQIAPANVEFDAALHERERKCARIFPQRYVTWCVRKRRFASAGGAANQGSRYTRIR